jgi:3-phytase
LHLDQSACRSPSSSRGGDHCPSGRWVTALLLLAASAVGTVLGPASASSSPLVFTPLADARVEAARSGQNFRTYVNSPGLRVDGDGDPDVRSYIRFRVNGVTGAVVRDTLQLYVPPEGGTADGPQVHRVRNDWKEGDVTWKTQPKRTGGPYADAGVIAEGGWAGFDVTSAIRGDATYTFALFSRSRGGPNFHAREATNLPQLVVATGTGGAPDLPPDSTPPLIGSVVAAAETAPAHHDGDAADDPAIWIHPTDPGQSTIIGTDKLGGLAVYDLAGNELAYYADSTPNNVDLRYNFPLGGERVALVVTSDTATDSLRTYRIDPATRELIPVAARTIDVGIGVAGLCMYVSPDTGKYYAFVGDNSGTVQQWELFDDGSGHVDATKVRTLSLGSTTEGCVADDATGDLYIAEEDVAIWKYGAEPDAGPEPTRVDVVSNDGHLTADIEGLAIYYRGDGGGYLLASSQGDDVFVVYERGGTNAYVTTFSVADGAVDGVSHTDGLDVTSAALGAAFPDGLFVAQDDQNDGGNQNFKLVSWGDIARAASPALAIDTGWDPRRVGG